LEIVEAGNQERAGQFESAIRLYQEGVAVLDEVTAAHPTPENQILLASTLRDLGVVLHRHHDDTGARPFLRRAFDLSREVLKAAPDVPRYREVFYDTLMQLCDTLIALGEHVAASDTALTAVGSGPEPGDGAYSAARVFALCIGLATKDSKLSEAGRDERTRYYSERALDLLQRSIAKGFKDAARVKKDPSFEPLRNRADFQKLLLEMETKPKA